MQFSAHDRYSLSKYKSPTLLNEGGVSNKKICFYTFKGQKYEQIITYRKSRKTVNISNNIMQ